MNSIIITGNLTRDPEQRTTQGGVSSCMFTVAVQRKYKNSQGVREADFLRVVCWRDLADICAKYLTKGRKVAVRGNLQNRKYTAQDGTDHFVTEIVADEVEFLSRNENKEQQSGELPTEMTPVEDDDFPY